MNTAANWTIKLALQRDKDGVWETQECSGEEDVLEEGEESPCIIPPVPTSPQPQTKERHAYRHKATDRFSDCIYQSSMHQRVGARVCTFDLDERVVDVDAHDERMGERWGRGALGAREGGGRVDIREWGRARRPLASGGVQRCYLTLVPNACFASPAPPSLCALHSHRPNSLNLIPLDDNPKSSELTSRNNAFCSHM